MEGTQRQGAVLDETMSALLADLQSKGLLGKTLVVLGTEFGLTSRINDNDGLDEHDSVSCLLVGACVRGGQVDRETDGRGGEVEVTLGGCDIICFKPPIT